MLVSRKRHRRDTIFTYRAVEAGTHTLVMTPQEPGPDGCVSCVTSRYYITVVR